MPHPLSRLLQLLTHMTVLLGFLHRHHPPQSTIPWLSKPVADLLFLFLVNLWFCYLFLGGTKHVYHLSSNCPLAFDMFRWDLRLQDPWTECPLWGSGPRQVHWWGGHPGQRQAGLWASEGAHLHHPGLRLWRGSWWCQHEEVPQVSHEPQSESTQCASWGFQTRWMHLKWQRVPFKSRNPSLHWLIMKIIIGCRHN